MSIAEQTDAGNPEPVDTTLAQLLDGELRKRLGLTPEQLRVGLTIARNHLTRGAPADALKVYVALVLCEPLNADFQVGLANCASVLGEHHVALQAASAVIAIAPRDPRGYLLSGRSCMMLGNYAEAKEDLNDALAFADGNETVATEAKHLLERLAVAASA